MQHLVWEQRVAIAIGVALLVSFTVWFYVQTAHTRKRNRAVRAARRQRQLEANRWAKARRRSSER